MSDLDPLEARLDAMLRTTEEQRVQWQQHAHERMRENEEKAGRFNKAAVLLMTTVIRPRMELVVRKFKNASLVVADAAAAYRCACTFDHTTQFPASTRLEFAAGPDDRLEQLIISYHLEILPVFISFKGMDQIAFPLNAVDEKLAAAWIDDRLADFTAAYLQLETGHAYQQENMETDPVCGMPVNRNWAAAQMEYAGRIYYFCIEDCRTRFAAEPERYATKRR